MVQGKVVKGTLGNAFNGQDDWAAPYGTIFSNSTSPGNYSCGSFTQLANLDRCIVGYARNLI